MELYEVGFLIVDAVELFAVIFLIVDAVELYSVILLIVDAVEHYAVGLLIIDAVGRSEDPGLVDERGTADVQILGLLQHSCLHVIKII